MKEIIFKIIFIVSLAGLLVIVFLKAKQQKKPGNPPAGGPPVGGPPTGEEKKEENTEEPKDNFWQKLKE